MGRLDGYCNQDSFFQSDMKEKLNSWVADINPLNDNNVLKNTLPSSLYSFAYNDGNNWMFDYRYMKPNVEYNSYYMKPGAYSNYSLNDTMVNNYKQYAHDSSVYLPSSTDRDFIQPNVIAFGGSFINHVYSIDIQNVGSYTRTFKYNYLQASDALTGVVYNVYDCNARQYTVNGDKAIYGEEGGDEPMEYDDGRDVFNLVTVVLPQNAHYIITVSIMPGVGTAGARNILSIS
jgi:hypothetical protein